jgi:hypothetical protein
LRHVDGLLPSTPPDTGDEQDRSDRGKQGQKGRQKWPDDAVDARIAAHIVKALMEEPDDWKQGARFQDSKMDEREKFAELCERFAALVAMMKRAKGATLAESWRRCICKRC